MTEGGLATVCTTTAKKYSKASCTLNRSFEHINSIITFDLSYCYLSACVLNGDTSRDRVLQVVFQHFQLVDMFLDGKLALE